MLQQHEKADTQVIKSQALREMTGPEFDALQARLGIDTIGAKLCGGVWRVIAITHAGIQHHDSAPDMVDAMAKILASVEGAQA